MPEAAHVPDRLYRPVIRDQELPLSERLFAPAHLLPAHEIVLRAQHQFDFHLSCISNGTQSSHRPNSSGINLSYANGVPPTNYFIQNALPQQHN